MASGAREPRRSRVMYALLHLEAGDARLQTVRGVVEALDGRVRLTQRLNRQLRRLVELDPGQLDLLGGAGGGAGGAAAGAAAGARGRAAAGGGAAGGGPGGAAGGGAGAGGARAQ